MNLFFSVHLLLGSYCIYPWTSPEKVVHYPVRLGYASTLHKVQGATLGHVTLWLDITNMPAAAYVALSRVRYDRNSTGYIPSLMSQTIRKYWYAGIHNVYM